MFETRPILRPCFRSSARAGQRVLVQLEVLRVLPALGDLLGDRSDLVALPSHAPHDVLGEAHPDLLVMVELRMVLEIQDGSFSRLAVLGGIERQPVALPCQPVALGAELGAGLREGEVDVEEDGPQWARHAWPWSYTPAGQR